MNNGKWIMVQLDPQLTTTEDACDLISHIDGVKTVMEIPEGWSVSLVNENMPVQHLGK